MMIPQGSYLCRVTDQEIAKTSTGKDQFVLTFKVLSQADGTDVDEQVEGRYYRVINQKTMPYFMSDLENLGLEKFSSFADLAPDSPRSFVGKEVVMYAKHDSYNGQPKIVWGVSGGGHKVATSEDIHSLDKLFAPQMRAKFKGAGAPPPTPDPNNPAPHEDSAVPF